MRRPDQRLALLLLLGTAPACEYATVVGVREVDDGFEAGTADEASEGSDASLDLPNEQCAPPKPVSCDDLGQDPLQAVGLDCVGGTPAAGGVSGPPGAAAVHSGAIGPYAPREGEAFLILSTGQATQLSASQTELAGLGCDDPPHCPSTNFGAGPGTLPAPIDVDPVDDESTCVDDPSLIGSGDCSNSLAAQWAACVGDCEVWDYAELRLSLVVPPDTWGLAFDFAFMSVEWPEFENSSFNDMFVAWLESESWTGNISFDSQGSPITVNASFTEFTGDELDGFAMEGHAGTRWLSTDIGVHPGEALTLVLAVFDISDGDYDSVVLLDGFRWTCSGTPPTTKPVP